MTKNKYVSSHTYHQNQDAVRCVLCRKTEHCGWRKKEVVWRKNDFCGENVKNAGEKKLYHQGLQPLQPLGPPPVWWSSARLEGLYTVGTL